jgi:hypothetical protein
MSSEDGEVLWLSERWCDALQILAKSAILLQWYQQGEPLYPLARETCWPSPESPGRLRQEGHHACFHVLSRGGVESAVDPGLIWIMVALKGDLARTAEGEPPDVAPHMTAAQALDSGTEKIISARVLF